MLSWLRNTWRAVTGRIGAPAVRARYDSAATNSENRRHWANADALSANAANSVAVRKTLRMRARYETANNSYARGIVNTLANDVVGRGPRLQMLGTDAESNRIIEAEFAKWARAVGLAEKLRTMRATRAVDGEAFALLTSNPRLPTPVKLDIRLVEAEQIATPGASNAAGVVDGIEFDQYGNVSAYSVLRAHPGDGYGDFSEADWVSAGNVLHWFRADRPGQARGIPEITPALPLFAQLRRYTLAVIAAAETAADYAAVLYTDSPANGEADSYEDVPPEIEIERRVMTTLPAGWKFGQFDAKQPVTTYKMFKDELLNEIARCLNMPFNVAAGNSSGYNYASGRLDHQTYYAAIGVDRSDCEIVVLNRIKSAWFAEALLIPGYLPTNEEIPNTWFWDGREHVDPLKEASAQRERLANNTTTLADEWAARGHDWESKLRQRAKEIQLLKELGITIEQAMPTPAPTQSQPIEDVTDADAAADE